MHVRRLDHTGRKRSKLHCGAGQGTRARLGARPARYSDGMARRIPTGLVLILALSLAGCSRTTDEQRIREAMAAMQQAMETRDPRAFMTHVSDDFIGNDAEFDRAALGNLLRVEALRNDRIGATLGPIDVEMQGDRARAQVLATFTGGSGNLLPERGSIYSITSSWKRQGSDWRCYSATWKQQL